MNQFILPVVASFACALGAVAADQQHRFKKTVLTDKFWGEGANFGDFNHDGKLDIVSGPYWYAGPDFTARHEYYPAKAAFTRKSADGAEEKIEGFEGALGVANKYSDNFIAFAADFNRDGWDDILIMGFPGEATIWYENPKGGDGHWPKHIALDVTDNESPTFADLTGDKKLEIVCSSKGFYGYAAPDAGDPTKPWPFHPISPNNKYHKFTHGLGVGDVNGDGRPDLLEKNGWWEHPKSLAGDPVWTFHDFAFNPGSTGGSQMYAYDVNGDGRNDVITAFHAHGFGLVWWEQVRTNGGITFSQHAILNTEQKRVPNEHGVTFSQLHALALADMDGDGLKDLVTGKRFWAHGPSGDADSGSPAVLYWFKLVRGPKHTAEFVPHLIDESSGVGTQVVVAPCSNKNLPDIVVGNKRGTFYFQHQTAKAK
ncbi:MAG: VCBS repeat-containing protein [Pedosphaera sp.]|nr:VCBS repeat-containing protein [Pedosphaera sp.]